MDPGGQFNSVYYTGGSITGEIKQLQLSWKINDHEYI